MGVQIVLDKPHPLHARIMTLDEIAQKVRIIDRRSLGAHLDVTKPGLWFKSQQHTTCALSLIFIIPPLRLAQLHRQRYQYVP